MSHHHTHGMCCPSPETAKSVRSVGFPYRLQFDAISQEFSFCTQQVDDDEFDLEDLCPEHLYAEEKSKNDKARKVYEAADMWEGYDEKDQAGNKVELLDLIEFETDKLPLEADHEGRWWLGVVLEYGRGNEHESYEVAEYMDISFCFDFCQAKVDNGQEQNNYFMEFLCKDSMEISVDLARAVVHHRQKDKRFKNETFEQLFHTSETGCS